MYHTQSVVKQRGDEQKMDKQNRDILKRTTTKLILKDLSKLQDIETDFEFKEVIWTIQGRLEFAESEINRKEVSK